MVEPPPGPEKCQDSHDFNRNPLLAQLTPIEFTDQVVPLCDKESRFLCQTRPGTDNGG